MTSLHYAAATTAYEDDGQGFTIIHDLIDAGARLNGVVCVNDGQADDLYPKYFSPLHFALQNNAEVAIELLQAGADANITKCAPPLIHLACENLKENDMNRGLQILGFLCTSGSVNTCWNDEFPKKRVPNQYTGCALSIVIERHLVDAAQLLMSIPQIDINMQRSDFMNPILLACQKGHKDVIETLLANPRLDASLSNSSGDNLLHLLVRNSNTAMIKVVLNLMKEGQIKDGEGNSCHHLLLMHENAMEETPLITAERRNIMLHNGVEKSLVNIENEKELEEFNRVAAESDEVVLTLLKHYEEEGLLSDSTKHLEETFAKGEVYRISLGEEDEAL